MKIKLEVIERDALVRPAGYKETILSVGTVKGEFVEIDPPDYSRIRVEYTQIAPQRAIILTQEEGKRPERKMEGLGDLVEKFAQPIAKAIDKVAGTNVQGCGGCKKRKQALNKLVPF